MALVVDGPVLLAGAGKMGTALLSGWLDRGLSPSGIIIQEPRLAGAAAELIGKWGIASSPALAEMPSPPSVIVVAVKPQTMDDVFPSLAKLAGPNTVVMSIAA